MNNNSIEIKFLLIAIVDEDTRGQYTSGPDTYNLVLGFETREQAQAELDNNMSYYKRSSKYIRRDAKIIELKEPLTDYSCLYNGWKYDRKLI